MGIVRGGNQASQQTVMRATVNYMPFCRSEPFASTGIAPNTRKSKFQMNCCTAESVPYRQFMANPNLPVVASKLYGTSIRSYSGTAQNRAQEIADNNPHILLAHADQRGYAVAEVTPRQWETSLRVLDDVKSRHSRVSTLTQFLIEDGKPGPQLL